MSEANDTANQINQAVTTQIDKAEQKADEIISEINATIAPAISIETNSTNN